MAWTHQHSYNFFESLTPVWRGYRAFVTKLSNLVDVVRKALTSRNERVHHQTRKPVSWFLLYREAQNL